MSIFKIMYPKINLNVQNIDGSSPLIELICLNKINLCKFLLKMDEKIDINLQTNSGSTALIQAVSGNHINLVKILLSKPKIKLNMQTKKMKNSALLIACLKNHVEIVKLLLKKSQIIDVTIQNKYGKNALNIAVENKQNKILKLFFKDDQVLIEKALAIMKKEDEKEYWIEFLNHVGKNESNEVFFFLFLSFFSNLFILKYQKSKFQHQDRKSEKIFLICYRIIHTKMHFFNKIKNCDP
jgi:hypothetical protein